MFDAAVTDVRRLDRLTLRAAELAKRVMGSLDDPEDWAQWRVGVHDRSGCRVLVQAFVQPADAVARAA